jgi:hypothetical protein
MIAALCASIHDSSSSRIRFEGDDALAPAAA